MRAGWARSSKRLLAVALVLIGGYGIYWLVERVFWTEGPSAGWWPWIVMIIPVSLVAYGTTSLVQLLWRSAVSTERRAAVVQKATEWEMPGGQATAGRPLLPAVPPIDAVVDSAGVQLAYRLPIDAASGWVSFTMAAVSLGWITLVGILFMFNVVGRGSEEPRNWLLTWLMVPFVLAGMWTLLALGRQMLLTAAIGATRVEVSHHPFVPGRHVSRLCLADGPVALSLVPSAAHLRRASDLPARHRHPPRHTARVSGYRVQPAQVRYHAPAGVRDHVRVHHLPPARCTRSCRRTTR